MALTRIVSEIIQDNTIENRDISGSFTAGISGSWRGELSSSNMTDVGGGVSGSVTSTGSFGRVEAAGVVFACGSLISLSFLFDIDIINVLPFSS